MPLIPFHLRDPLVHLAKLVLKRLLQLLCRAPHGISLIPVLIAVRKDLVHVCQELLFVIVLLVVHLVLHRRQVHGLLDHVEVVGYAIALGVDGILEGPNDTGPKAWL